MSAKVKTALAIVIGFISIIGSVAAYDARVAKQCDLEMLSSRLEQKIVPTGYTSYSKESGCLRIDSAAPVCP
jgi:hypothetical protein